MWDCIGRGINSMPGLYSYRETLLGYEEKPLYSTRSEEFHLGSISTLNKISDKKKSPFKVDNMIRAERKITFLYNIVNALL